MFTNDELNEHQLYFGQSLYDGNLFYTKII